MVRRTNSFNVRVKIGRWASAPNPSLREKYAEAQQAASGPGLQEDGDRHGAGDGHEQTHEPVGRPEDHGGDQEGGLQWGSPT